MLAHFPLRLGRCQLQSLCIYSHASCKVSTRALGGRWLVLGLLSRIRVRNEIIPLQHPCKFCLEVFEVEEDNHAPPSIEKDVAPVKGKGKGMKDLDHASH